MKMNVSLQNPYTKEIKSLHTGWNWLLCLLSPVLGIPLFQKGLTNWGFVFLALNGTAILGRVQAGASDWSMLLVLTNLITVGLMVFMGLRGNELIAKNLLLRGWQFMDPTSDAVRYARMEWKIDETSAPAPATTPAAN